ncbi:hypothetical protein E1A91_D01G116100v1 [Gossypium mustelinum]|uniref:Uncharacterized protein n=2 Tax=Gossypium TaxID=3633 RepID=A0A5D2W618_GOSMU|nr:hypothetical protein ES288_D01G121100v1 [Gossypium darwinii]TYI97047.1 hypothetical protein E1A91_D01G116100v1 [Gossypium mustelinum]
MIFDTNILEASKEWIEAYGGTGNFKYPVMQVVKLLDFFFYNRKLKRVVSLSFCCLSNLVVDGFAADYLSYEEDGEIFDNMDI